MPRTRDGARPLRGTGAGQPAGCDRSAGRSGGVAQAGMIRPAVCALAAAKRCCASAQLTTFHHALA